MASSLGLDLVFHLKHICTFELQVIGEDILVLCLDIFVPWFIKLSLHQINAAE